MVYRFKVLPMGLAVSPGVFQHYTSRHVARFKLEPRVREVLAAGSAIEVLVDDFLLGSSNEELHLELLDLWLTYAEANRLFFKTSKCEFMKDKLTVLGREVGDGWWGPLEDRVQKVCLQKPRNVSELRSVLGSVNWLRRHIRNIAPTWKLSELLKRKRWSWGVEQDQAWRELQQAVQEASVVHVPQGSAAIVLITDSSEEGGGGSLLQRQREEWKFLGHWGWKWTGPRARYSTFEKELLAGVLLVASQRALLRTTKELHWCTDAAAVVDFVKGTPPENNKRRLRWWYMLQQYPLHMHFVQGVKNEWCDYLSRIAWQEWNQDLVPDTKSAFRDLEDELLVLDSGLSRQVDWKAEDVAVDFPFVTGLQRESKLFVDGRMWTQAGDHIFMEMQRAVPERFLEVFF